MVALKLCLNVLRCRSKSKTTSFRLPSLKKQSRNFDPSSSQIAHELSDGHQNEALVDVNNQHGDPRRGTRVDVILGVVGYAGVPHLARCYSSI